MEQRLAFDGEISTRTPHAGSDMFIVALNLAVTIFQPALPMRGVTMSRPLKSGLT